MPPPISFKGLQAKKPSGPPKPKASLQRPVFGRDDDDDDDDDEAEEQTASVFAGKNLKNNLKTKPSGPPSRSTKPGSEAPQQLSLSARHSATKNATMAQELDPTVYEYDAVYDSMQVEPASKASGNNGSGPGGRGGSGGSDGPRYMAALLKAAEVRERDRLRAKEKMLTREREAEGDAFAGKDAFVTGAYRAQQAELHRLADEEAAKEEAERAARAKTGGGMTALYKNLLGREDERHEAAMKAAEEARARLKEKRGEAEGAEGGAAAAERDGPKSRQQLEREEEAMLAQKRGVQLNDDGQVIDKRQLLKAGLNVTKKTQAREDERRRAQATSAAAAAAAGDRSAGLAGRVDAKQAVRERQTRMLEQQLEESAKRAVDDEQTERETLERANKRKATEKDVGSAKERYLARKRAAEEAAKAAAAAE